VLQNISITVMDLEKETIKTKGSILLMDTFQFLGSVGVIKSRTITIVTRFNSNNNNKLMFSLKKIPESTSL
jgi:hypothetical protein